MTPQPKLPSFSVLVANRNHAKLVTQAVDSVLSQDYPAGLREVVVVDDASTDDSPERLRAYQGKPGVVVVMLQHNRGQTGAFATALEQARGDYVCLLDSDDTCLPHKLRRLAEHIATLDAAPDNLFLCHDLLILDGPAGESIASTWFDVVNLHRFGPLLQRGQAYHQFPFSVTSGMVFGSELLRQMMDRLPQWEWPMGVDAILGHATLLLTSVVHYLGEPLGRYVVHGRNDLASIVDGEFRAKAVWQGRWPKNLRFLELLAHHFPASTQERADRLAYVGRLEHTTRAALPRLHHARPLLSFIVDATAPGAFAFAQATAAALQAQGHAHHEQVWLCPDDASWVPCDALVLRVPDGTHSYQRMRQGLTAARGGFVCFLEAGDLPEPRFAEVHLQAHGVGSLPMLTACDLRLLDAQGVLLHSGILGLAAHWGTLPPTVPAFGGLLQDWQLAPLPALVLRRTPYLAAFFDQPDWPAHELHDRHVGWLLAQYVLQLGGGTRVAECLVDLRLPANTTPNASWLSQFIDRHGPLPKTDLACCADWLFRVYTHGLVNGQPSFSAAWEIRFVQWLLQSGGAAVPAKLQRAAQQCGDADWEKQVLNTLRAALQQ
jgi:glycosyltransferase involved in cell wall biosynthesis